MSNDRLKSASDAEAACKSRPPRILLSGGGTSGHIHPALAIAQGVLARCPAATVAFAGTQTGLESQVIPKAGYDFYPISAGPFPRRISPGFEKALRLFFQGKREALELIKTFQPDLVVGTGGYVCGPLLAAAHARKIPVLIHEQNAYPGRSNRFAARRNTTVCLGYGAAAPYFRRAKRVIETGNPVRAAFWDPSLQGEAGKIRARRLLNLPEQGLLVLISGGSLGARQLNRVALEWAQAQPHFPGQVLLATGSRLYDETCEAARDLPTPSPLRIYPYLDQMALYLAAADLVIGRAGASTCAELAALGKPTLFIPYPYAAGNHQLRNAQVFSESGAGLCVPEKAWTAKRLAETLQALVDDPARWQKMGASAQAWARPQAVEQLVEICQTLTPFSWPNRDDPTEQPA